MGQSEHPIKYSQCYFGGKTDFGLTTEATSVQITEDDPSSGRVCSSQPVSLLTRHFHSLSQQNYCVPRGEGVISL